MVGLPDLPSSFSGKDTPLSRELRGFESRRWCQLMRSQECHSAARMSASKTDHVGSSPTAPASIN